MREWRRMDVVEGGGPGRQRGGSRSAMNQNNHRVFLAGDDSPLVGVQHRAAVVAYSGLVGEKISFLRSLDSRPLTASPETSHPGCACKSDFMPRRTTSWSSAMRMRIAIS